MANVSVIIPTLNALPQLQPTADVIMRGKGIGLIQELIIADGGSIDGTREAAIDLGAVLVDSTIGRGYQLSDGVKISKGEWLLIVHADTILDLDWAKAVKSFINLPENRMRAAYFQFALDDKNASARRIERMVAWRSRVLGLPYGDQGLLISRDMYDKIGGYPAIPLMEDVVIIRRIGRRRLHGLNSKAVTSSERFRRGGYWLRPSLNMLCLALFCLGISADMIRKIYR